MTPRQKVEMVEQKHALTIHGYPDIPSLQIRGRDGTMIDIIPKYKVGSRVFVNQLSMLEGFVGTILAWKLQYSHQLYVLYQIQTDIGNKLYWLSEHQLDIFEDQQDDD